MVVNMKCSNKSTNKYQCLLLDSSLKIFIGFLYLRPSGLLKPETLLQEYFYITFKICVIFKVQKLVLCTNK